MNVLSLFSGIGGLDLGLERAGMTIAGQVEIDPWCRGILEKHWPEVPRHDDVTTCVPWWQALADTAGGAGHERRDAQGPGADGSGPQLQVVPGRSGGSGVNGHAPRRRFAADLVCGGFPCQPVSLAGKGLAQADSRWLWPATFDVIRVLRPRWVLLENVPGLLGRGMGDVLGDLAACGYDAEWDCVPACFVGAPHIRDRVWIVAYPGSAGRPEVTGSAPGHESQDARRPAPRDHVADGDGQGHRTGTVADAQELHGDGTDRQPRRDIPEPRDDRGAGRVRRRMADPDLQPKVWPAIPRTQRGTWPAEPGVGRVAHGIPRRVDRLRGLGNAVVPQVAELIGRLIMEAAA